MFLNQLFKYYIELSVQLEIGSVNIEKSWNYSMMLLDYDCEISRRRNINWILYNKSFNRSNCSEHSVTMAACLHHMNTNRYSGIYGTNAFPQVLITALRTKTRSSVCFGNENIGSHNGGSTWWIESNKNKCWNALLVW